MIKTVLTENEIIFNDFSISQKIEPPFNYTGSKYKILDQLLVYFDYSKENFVDLFAGGGSVYANVVQWYEKIYVNDIIKDLINIHKDLIYDVEKTVKLIKQIVVKKDNKEGYLKLRESYNLDPTPIKLYALMLCCTNNMMRFNKKFEFNQTFGKRSFNSNTHKKILNFSNSLQKYKNNLIFSHVTFKDFEVPDNSFVYLDPPYSNTEAGYNSYWDKNDDVELFKYCQKLHERKITFAVSGVEIEEQEECRLLKLLQGEKYIDMKEIEFDYNKVSRAGKKKFKELLLVNF